MRAHERYIRYCRDANLPARLRDFTKSQCRAALYLIERACGDEGYGGFRDIRTQWERLV